MTDVVCKHGWSRRFCKPCSNDHFIASLREGPRDMGMLATTPEQVPDDLIARLRDADTTRRIGESYADTHERRQRDRNEAADEIERLRAALRDVHAAAGSNHLIANIARAALGGSDD